MKTLFWACLAILSVTDCAQKQDGVDLVLPADPAKLVGNWVLVDNAQPTEITMTIESVAAATPTKYALRGKGLMNSYGAVLDVAPRANDTAPGEIRITDVARASKVGETDDIRQRTDNYLAALGAVSHYTLLANGQLRLTYCLWCEFSITTLTFKRQ